LHEERLIVQQKMLDRLDVSLNQIGRLAESDVQGEDMLDLLDVPLNL